MLIIRQFPFRALANEREPIRISLDFRIDNNEYQCVTIGQEVTWQNVIFQCEAEDIFNETQKSALKGTMEKVRVHPSHFFFFFF